jgi:hypothetical protein
MSFRYTNSLTGVLRHRELLERGRRRLVLRTFEGRCDGVMVTYTAYGQVKSITVAPDARKRYEDAKGLATNLDGLAAAIKGAVCDANRQLRAAKEELYRQSFTTNEELKKNPHYEMWVEQDGTTLPPLPYDALKDSSVVVNELSRRDPTRPAEQVAFTSPVNGHPASSLPETIGTKAAGGSVGQARNVTGLAAVHRAFTPALLLIDDEAAAEAPASERAATGTVDLALASQRYPYAEQERYFWKRVELIRRAQVNVIGSTRKRGYAKNTRVPTETESSVSPDAFVEKVKLNFVA